MKKDMKDVKPKEKKEGAKDLKEQKPMKDGMKNADCSMDKYKKMKK